MRRPATVRGAQGQGRIGLGLGRRKNGPSRQRRQRSGLVPVSESRARATVECGRRVAGASSTSCHPFRSLAAHFVVGYASAILPLNEATMIATCRGFSLGLFLLVAGCGSPPLVGTWRAEFRVPSGTSVLVTDEDLSLRDDHSAAILRTEVFPSSFPVWSSCRRTTVMTGYSWREDGPGRLSVDSPTPTATVEVIGCQDPTRNQASSPVPFAPASHLVGPKQFVLSSDGRSLTLEYMSEVIALTRVM